MLLFQFLIITLYVHRLNDQNTEIIGSVTYNNNNNNNNNNNKNNYNYNYNNNNK